MAKAPTTRNHRSMIRIAIVDDHYAVRLGLKAMLSAEPDMEPVGTATTAADAWPLLYRTAPDVVVLDYRLPDVDGLTLCARIKGDAPAPAVVLHSAFADEVLIVAALIAGADGVVHKGAPGRELAEAIRSVAAGRTALPALDPELVRAGAEVIDAENLPILGMLAHGTPRDEIARVLNLDTHDLNSRLSGMLARLRAVRPQADVPSASRV